MMRNGLIVFLAILAATFDLAVSKGCSKKGKTCKKCLKKGCAWYIAGTGPDFLGCLEKDECLNDPKWEGGTCLVKEDDISIKKQCKKPDKPKKDKCEKKKDCEKCLSANTKVKGLDCAWWVIEGSDEGSKGGTCMDAKTCRSLKALGTCFGADITEKFGKYCNKIHAGEDFVVTPPGKGWPHLVGGKTSFAEYYFETYWPDYEVQVLGPDDFYTFEFRDDRIRVFVDDSRTKVIDEPNHPKIG